MLDPLLTHSPHEDAHTPARVVSRARPGGERDEFGVFDGAAGVLRASPEPAGLLAREDLGHALCAWLPREDLL